MKPKFQMKEDYTLIGDTYHTQYNVSAIGSI